MLPTLLILSGKATHYNPSKRISLAHNYSVCNTRSQFLKASIVNDEATVLSHQNSSMLNTFSLANGLLYLSEGEYELEKGAKVDIYHI